MYLNVPITDFAVPTAPLSAVTSIHWGATFATTAPDSLCSAPSALSPFQAKLP